MRATDIGLPPSPRCLLVHDLERAFPDAQIGGTRLVLTQSTYLVQTWVDRLSEGDCIVATADRVALERCTPEALNARGPWRAFEIVDLDSSQRRFFANGDAEGAERDLWRMANTARPDEREDLLLEAYEIAQALLTEHPALAPHRLFLDRIGAEIAKSE